MGLQAFLLRDLQNSTAIIDDFISDGVTDGRVMRQKIQEYIAGKTKKRKQQSANPAKQPEKKCPECGMAKLITPVGVAEPVLVCPLCRYSFYAEVQV